MKILFHLGHPAHYHLFKHIIRGLRRNGHQIKILIKKKDVLENLLRNDDEEYVNIHPKERGSGRIAAAWSVIKKDFALFSIARSFRPDIMTGTSAEITHIGSLLKISSIVVNEDDAAAVPLFSAMAYPLADTIVTPSSCTAGRWSRKQVSYDGYHELAYLAPGYFTPDEKKLHYFNPGRARYFILRFADLTAHHDRGKKGIGPAIAAKIISLLEPHGKVFITSERKLEPGFERYRLTINPADIHHALSFADICIGDSQTMAAESAVLGTPSLRFNDFAGKLGYLEELEQRYRLTAGIRTSDPHRLFDAVTSLLNTDNLRDEWQKRRRKMLSDKIDVTSFFIWFIENYPASSSIMKGSPDFQDRFR